MGSHEDDFLLSLQWHDLSSTLAMVTRQDYWHNEACCVVDKVQITQVNLMTQRQRNTHNSETGTVEPLPGFVASNKEVKRGTTP